MISSQKSISLSDLRNVLLIFTNSPSSPSNFIVHKDEVDRLVEVCIKLHHSPGKNPHNGGDTAKIERIFVEEGLEPKGPYWWSTPDLKKNDDPNGASVFGWTKRTLVFEATNPSIIGYNFHKLA